MLNGKELKRLLLIIPALMFCWFVGFIFTFFFEDYWWIAAILYTILFTPIVYLQYKNKKDKNSVIANRIFRVLNWIMIIAVLYPMIDYIFFEVQLALTDPNVPFIHLLEFQVKEFFTTFDGLLVIYDILLKHLYYIVVACLLFLSVKIVTLENREIK